jgi:hypothetical protein
VSQVKTNATNTDSLEGKAYTVHVGKTEVYPWGAPGASDVRGISQKYFRVFRHILFFLPILALSTLLYFYHTSLMSCVERHAALHATHAGILKKFYLFPKDPTQ